MVHVPRHRPGCHHTARDTITPPGTPSHRPWHHHTTRDTITPSVPSKPRTQIPHCQFTSFVYVWMYSISYYSGKFFLCPTIRFPQQGEIYPTDPFLRLFQCNFSTETDIQDLPRLAWSSGDIPHPSLPPSPPPSLRTRQWLRQLKNGFPATGNIHHPWHWTSSLLL